MAATSEICDRKLVIPRRSVLLQMLPLSRKSVLKGFTCFMCTMYQTARTAVTICPITVANAAPIMPHWNTKIKIGSRIIFRIAPASVEAMANLGLPSERIIGFSACPNI